MNRSTGPRFCPWVSKAFQVGMKKCNYYSENVRQKLACHESARRPLVLSLGLDGFSNDEEELNFPCITRPKRSMFGHAQSHRILSGAY